MIDFHFKIFFVCALKLVQYFHKCLQVWRFFSEPPLTLNSPPTWIQISGNPRPTFPQDYAGGSVSGCGPRSSTTAAAASISKSCPLSGDNPWHKSFPTFAESN